MGKMAAMRKPDPENKIFPKNKFVQIAIILASVMAVVILLRLIRG